MIYQWREGSRFRAKAQEAGELVAQIEAESGGVAPPAAIVRAARPVTSPIHDDFVWSNSKAARLYREEQARKLVRSLVVIKVSEGSDEPLPSVAFVHVKPAGASSGYMTTSRAMTDAVLRRQAIRECLALLDGIKRRFEHLSELGSVFAEIDRASAILTEPEADQEIA